MAENQIGRNIAFKIYNADGTEFEGLVMYKSTFETVVMSLGDKITGDVYYKDNGLAVTMQEYIVYNGVKYILVNPPTIIREGIVSDNSELKGMTRYSFVFYHPMCLLGNFPFTDIAVTSGQQKYLSQNKTFSWIGNLVDFVAKLNKNLEGTEWVCEIGDTVTSEIYNKLSEVLSFDKQTIADVIKTGYDTWKVPYIVDVIASTDSRYASGKRFLVRYGLPSQEIVGSGGNPFVFEFGKGVGLKNNSRTPKNNKIITRIAGYGSENNIPYGYPQIVWTGNQDWDYTINNNPSAANSYPIYDGIVNGQRVRLIKHPFTRNHLMPSIYSDTVNKKVNPNATGYNPNIEIKDYYDAVSSPSYTYPNPINPNSPSYDIHEFEEIKPELGQAAIAGVSAYDLEHQGAISVDDAQSLLLDYYSESHNETEKIQLNRLIFNLPTATELSGHSDAASYHYEWSLKSDAYYAYIKYTSSILNFTCIVLRAAQPPAPTWDDTMDDDGNYKQSYFKITLPQLSFDLYACAAITQEMSINMRSGACIGCTFPVMVDWDDYKKNFYDADGNFDPVIGEGHPRNADKYPNSASGQITVIVQKDNSTFGTLMPNVYQNPTANDQFVILGISLPLSYVSNAESRLDNEMIQYMKDNNVYYFEYPLKFDEHFLATHTNILQQMKCNTIVRFKYNGVTIPLYIKQMSVKFGQSPLPQYDITLTDDIQVVLNPIGKAVETFRTMIENGAGLGGIDLNALYSRLDERYLSKMDDDTAAGFVRLLRGLQVGERFVTGLLGEGGVFRTESDGTTYLEVDKMYVRMKAYFDTVEIRRFMHSNGNRIASLAGIKCSRVEYIDANGDVTEDATQATKFRCYFRANNNGETVTNDFVVGDLAFCKETNAKVGTGVEQHGYWRAVVGKNTLLTDEGEAWIDLSASDCLDGSDIPLAQDDIVQLGNKTDTTRQGAIIEYVGGADAPSYQIYQNINTYSLENKNYVAMGYNSSTGRAYLNVYGDFRFGSKNDSGSYLSYNAQTGILNVKAVINAQSTIGNQSIDQYIKAHQNNYDDSWIQPALDAIQEQIDGELDTWYYSGVPTLNNLPASQWTTDDLKKEHVGDLYYDKDSGLAYRFIYDNDTQTYLWSRIHDDAISEALKIANQAQDTADNKRRVFICDAQHPTPTPPYDAGDLWVNVKYPFETGALYKDDILKCINTRATGTFNIADWSKASNYTDDSALLNFVNTTYAQDLQNIGTQIDKKAETWYQDTDPSLEIGWVDAEHVGDLWFCTAEDNPIFGKNTTWIYRQREGVTPAEYYWAQQAVPDVVFDQIDGKSSIFVSQPSNYKANDLWILAADTVVNGVSYKQGEVLTSSADSETYVASHWTKKVRYTDDTKYNNFINTLLNGMPSGSDETTVEAALNAIKAALNQGTTIDGGLVLSTLIGLRDSNNVLWSGISGAYDASARGGGIAAWYGGGMGDWEVYKETHPSATITTDFAKSLFRFDGSGYVAGGNITWNANGAVTIKNITTLSDSQNTNLLNELATFNNAFTFATSGQGSTTVLSITPNVPFTALSILENNVANAVATQAWVRQNVSGTFWGNPWTVGGTVSGHLIMNSGGTGIYLKSDGSGINWHNASNGDVSSLFAFTSSQIQCNQDLYIPSPKIVRIGDAVLVWDGDNNALKLRHASGANASVNFYATGGVSALGYSDSGGGGGGGDVTWELLANNSDTRPIALSHLTGALAGYATTSQLAGYYKHGDSPTFGDIRIERYGSSTEYCTIHVDDVLTQFQGNDPDGFHNFQFLSNGTSVMYINGQTGVTSVTALYSSNAVEGSGIYSRGYYFQADANGTYRSLIDRSGNTPIFGYGQSISNILTVYTGGTIRIVSASWDSDAGININATNDVGIGTTSPSYKLHVNGTFYASGNSSIGGTIQASSFIKNNGTSSQFLKADGSVDSNSYALLSYLSNYLPLSGGTLTGDITAPHVHISDTEGSDSLTFVRGNYSYIRAITTGGKIGFVTDGKAMTGDSVDVAIGNGWVSVNNGVEGSFGYNLYVNGSINGTSVLYNGNHCIHSGNIGSQSVNYANSAGSVAWTNVSGRPTNVSSFTNDSGYYKSGDSPVFDNISMAGYLYMTNASGSYVSTIDRSGDSPIFGYGQGVSGYTVYYTGRKVCINGGSLWNLDTGLTLTSDNYIAIGRGIAYTKFDLCGGQAKFGYGTGSGSIDNNATCIHLGTETSRSGSGYLGGIAFNQLLNYNGSDEYRGAPQAWIGLRIHDTSGSERANLVFATKEGVNNPDNPIERMTITPFGNVGIGTTSPSYKLDLAGQFKYFVANSGGALFGTNGNTMDGINSDGTLGHYHLNYNSTGNITLCYGGGNVGVGTASPSYKLDVNGNVRVSGNITTDASIFMQYYLHMKDASGNWISTIDRSGDSPIFGYGQGQSGYHVYYTGRTVSINAGTMWNNVSNGIYIDSSNNIGVGTDSPSYKLHVAGNIYARNNIISDGNMTITSIELNARGTLSGYGGFIDFHYNGSSADYTSRIIEDASGRLYLSATNGVRIGDAVLLWDSRNNALKLQNANGVAANFYTTGGLSALGISGAVDGTVNASLIPSATGTYSLGNTSYRWKELYLADANGHNGKIYTDYDGINLDSVNGGYFDGSRYIITGRLVVGTSDDSDQPNYNLYVAGNTYVDGSNAYFYGNVSVLSLTQRSDMRIKDVVSDLNLKISTVAQAPLFKYKLKQGDGTIMVGSSAQYWDALLPEVIHRDAEGILGLDYGVTALASVISVAKEVTEHERRIARLEAENAILRAQIEDLKAA